MEDDLECGYIDIFFSDKKFFVILFLSLYLMPIIFIVYYFMNIRNLSIIYFVVFLFITYIPALIVTIFLPRLLPFEKGNIITSRDTFSVFICNKLYFQVIWEDVTKIILSREKIPYDMAHGFSIEHSKGYKIEFINKNDNRIFRLWTLTLSKKKNKCIINSVKFIANLKDIEFIVNESIKKLDYLEALKLKNKVTNFKKGFI